MNNKSFSKVGALIILIILIGGGIFTYWLISKQESGPLGEIPPEKAIVTGQVIHKSDIMTIPDFPEEGTILAISSDDFDSFLVEAGFADEFVKSELWHFQGAVLDEIASKYFIASATLNSEGRFSMSLNRGTYILCLTNTRKQSPGELPVRFQGCLETEVQQGQELELNITSAFGGISIEK